MISHVKLLKDPLKKNKKVVITANQYSDKSLVSTSSNEFEDDIKLTIQGEMFGQYDYKYENERSFKKIKKYTIDKNSVDGKDKNIDRDIFSSCSSLLNIEFTFHDMSPKFHNSLNTLHVQTNSILSAHVSSMFIINQMPVGTIVSSDATIDNDDIVFGYITVVPCDDRLSIHDFIVTTCPIIRSISNVGLYIHGRMINLPDNIVIEYHQQILKDLSWAIENDDDFQNQNYDWFIIFAKFYTEMNDDIFFNFDDAIFAKNSKYVYTIKYDHLGSNFTNKRNIIPKNRINGDKVASKIMTKLLLVTREGLEHSINQLKKLQKL